MKSHIPATYYLAKNLLLNDKSKFIFLIIILSALSFNHAFQFHLFTDDWYQITGTLYYPEILKMYFVLHPANFFEFKLFSPLFQFNPYPWQFLGYLLRILGALSMWPLIIALTNSRKAAFYASLISAVFVVGIESEIWPSGHSSPIIVPLINLGFYFWIKSGESQSKIKFLFSIIFFALSILAEPGRAFIVILLIPIWELLSLYQRISIRKVFITLLRMMLFFFFILPAGILAQFFLVQLHNQVHSYPVCYQSNLTI